MKVVDRRRVPASSGRRSSASLVADGHEVIVLSRRPTGPGRGLVGRRSAARSTGPTPSSTSPASRSAAPAGRAVAEGGDPRQPRRDDASARAGDRRREEPAARPRDRLGHRLLRRERRRRRRRGLAGGRLASSRRSASPGRRRPQAPACATWPCGPRSSSAAGAGDQADGAAVPPVRRRPGRRWAPVVPVDPPRRPRRVYRLAIDDGPRRAR